MECVLINEIKSAATVHEDLGESKTVQDGTEDKSGWCSDCPVFWFITDIKGYSRVIPRVYRGDLTDFGEVGECPFALIV